MAYSKIRIYRKIINLFNDEKIGRQITCHQDVIDQLPISRVTYFKNWKINEFNFIKRRIEENVMRTKSVMRKKWFNSDNPTLQIAWYKLHGTEMEYHLLANTRHDILSGNKPLQPDVKLDKETVNRILEKL